MSARARSWLGHRLEALVSQGRATCIATNLRWGEGPAYLASRDLWVFSDIPNNRMLSWSRTTGLSTFRAPSHFANGNTTTLDGALLTCEHGTRRITRTAPDGSYDVLCGYYQGRRLNSPNDIVQHRDGTIWFSDPTYGILSDVEGFRAPAEQERNRVYRFDPARNDLSAQVDSLKMPNGLCFSPDYTTLYVADSGADMGPEVPFDDTGPREVYSFPLSAQDRVCGSGTLFARASKGVPDGIRCDREGNLWVSTGLGVECFAPSGAPIGVIETPQTVANLCFGGEGGHSMLLTLATSAYLLESAS